MKIIAFLLLLASYASAQSFVVQGTNVVQIAYEDSMLTASEKAFIEADVMRTITPGLLFATINVYTNWQNAGRFSRLYRPENDHEELSLSRELSIHGTNIIWEINKSYTDCYKANMSFFNMHSNAIAKAFEFANLLITNPISSMSSSQVKGLYLMKSFPPYGLADEHVEEFRTSIGEGVYFAPPFLGFSVQQRGPSEHSYLWGYLPARTDSRVDSVPIVYYKNRWWISYWGMFEEAQVW